MLTQLMSQLITLNYLRQAHGHQLIILSSRYFIFKKKKNLFQIMSIFISPQKVKIGNFQPYSTYDWLINFTINNQMVNALD